MRRPAQQGRSPRNSCEKAIINDSDIIARLSHGHTTKHLTCRNKRCLNNSLCVCFALGLMLLAFLCSPGSVLLLNKLIVLKGDQGTMTTFSSACLSRASPFRSTLGKDKRAQGDRATWIDTQPRTDPWS